MERFTNARGASASYSYDGNAKLTDVSYSDGTPGVCYNYDAYQRLDSMSDAIGGWSFGYDANSRLTSVNDPWDSDTLSYGYDELGRRSSMTPEAGTALTYVYDNLNRLTQIQLGSPGTAYSYSYPGVSPLVEQLMRPNGSLTTYAYNPLNQLTEIENLTSSGELITKHVYTYNGMDLRATEDSDGPAIPPRSESEPLERSYSYNSANQLITSSDPDRAFSYDADGNLTKGFTKDGFIFTADYDAENRMTSLEYKDRLGTPHRFEYTYSGDDLLAVVREYEDGTQKEETRILRDGMLALQDRDAENTILNEYAWGLNLGGGIGGLLNLKQGGTDYSYLYDGKGNVEAILDPAQAVVAGYRYDPFARLLAQTGSLTQPFRSSTKRYNAQLGMQHYQYRNYLPQIGRWTTRDPLGEAGGVNLYAFVGNNPVNWVDPWGLLTVIMVGSNVKNPQFFNNIANHMAGTDTDTIIVQIRTKAHVEKALQNPNITEIVYYGHAGPEELDISPTAAITKKDVMTLNTSNVQPGATIHLYGCRTGEGTNPIAQVVADHFQRPTLGMTTGLSFGIPGVNRLSPNSPFFWWPRAGKEWFSPQGANATAPCK